MTQQEFEAFKKAWEDYPSQDNEGFTPDRGSFKAGFFAGLRFYREKHIQFQEALKFLIEQSPHDGDNSACLYCDMGGSGYSSKGANHHDDLKHVCPVVKAQAALTENSELDLAQEVTKEGQAHLLSIPPHLT
jgi:hypothetical protein